MKCSDLSHTALEAVAEPASTTKKIKNKLTKAAKLPYKTLKPQIRVLTEENNFFYSNSSIRNIS